MTELFLRNALATLNNKRVRAGKKQIPFNPEMQPEELASLIRQQEAEDTKARQLQKLDRYNDEHCKKFMDIQKAVKVQHITEDIINNDGSLHKVKVRKYPMLKQLIDQGRHVRLEYFRGFVDSINLDGNTYQVADLATGEKFTLEQAIKANGINVKPMTWEEFNTIKAETEEAFNALEKALEKYDEHKNRVRLHNLAYDGLISESRYHYTKYIF